MTRAPLKFRKYSEGFQDCASLDAILAHLTGAMIRARDAQAEAQWLAELAQTRQQQVRAGTWPPRPADTDAPTKETPA